MIKILIYAVSIAHLRKAVLIANNFLNYEFVVVYELKNPFRSYKNITFIKLKNNRTIDKLFTNKFSYLILFNSQIRPIVLSLLITSNLFKIKTIALQENNSYFLHQKKFNNYQLPSDLIFLLSNYEKNFFLDNGYNANNLIVENFNFKNYKKNNKNSLKKIVFCLNASVNINPYSIENNKIINKVFQSIFNCLNHLKGIKIYIKKHPLDSITYVNKVTNNNKEIEILDDNIDLAEYLNEKDIVIVTGYSQLIFDLTILNIPVIIFNIEGNKNIFKNYLSISIIENSDDLIKIVKDKNIKKYIDDYSELIKINNINKFCEISNFFKIVDNYFKDYEYEKNRINNLFILLYWSNFLKYKIINSIKIKQLLKHTITNNQFALLSRIRNNSINEDDLIELKKYKFNYLYDFMVYMSFFLNIKNINKNNYSEFKKFLISFKPYGAYNVFYHSIQNLRKKLFSNFKSLCLLYDTTIKNDKFYLAYDSYYKKNKTSVYNFFKKTINKLLF